MEDLKILICIASHYYQHNCDDFENIQSMSEKLTAFNNKLNDMFTCFDEFFYYSKYVTIFVDTNSKETEKSFLENYPNYNRYKNNIKFFVHSNLENSFDLTWKHREHMRNEIDNYDWFLYSENDMLITKENFYNFVNKFSKLHIYNIIPSFIRVETLKGDLYISDCIYINTFTKQELITIDGELYVKLNNPYHAFWLLPQYFLKHHINDDLFVTRKSDYFDANHFPELGASYPMWQLGMIPVVELNKDYKICEHCYSFHLNNVSVKNPHTPFGKIKVSDVVQII